MGFCYKLLILISRNNFCTTYIHVSMSYNDEVLPVEPKEVEISELAEDDLPEDILADDLAIDPALVDDDAEDTLADDLDQNY